MNERDEDLARLEVLSAYVDGDLEGEALAEVEALLASSEAARAQVEELRDLKALAAETSTGPSRDLWPAIAAELEASKPANDDARPWRWWFVGAAAAVIAFVALRTPAPPPAKPTLSAQLADARAAYAAAIDRMAEESDAAVAKLPEDVRQQLVVSLAQVDRAIREAEAAMSQAPEDPFGHEALLALYSEKVRILEAVIAAAELKEEAS